MRHKSTPWGCNIGIQYIQFYLVSFFHLFSIYFNHFFTQKKYCTAKCIAQDIYYGKRTYVKYDKSALQWNKFVKDFCADDATKIYDERLKAAASLWSIVRDSDMKKEYSHELFEKNKDSITI